MKNKEELEEKERKKLVNERNGYIDKIMNLKPVQTFNKLHNKKFNFDSPQDLSELLFDIMKIKSVKKTATNKNSVDAEVLSKLDIPLADYIDANTDKLPLVRRSWCLGL